MKKVHRIQAVSDAVGLSKSEIYRLMTLGRFPRSISIGERAVAWTEESIEEWIQSKIDQ